MDITSDGGLSYVRGYMLIIGANLYYLFQRLVFRKICRKYYERTEKYLHPAVIVTEQQVMEDKPLKFTIFRKVLTLMIWMVVVGFIQVWRGLFATFDYIVDQMYEQWDMNKVLSSILLQLVVGLTLAFTQRNNAVNLCPTHKIYKYDELEEMDGLFSLHIFSNFLKHDESEAIVKNTEQGDDVTQFDPSPVKRKFTPLSPGFDLPQYAARKLSGQLHRSTSPSTSSLNSTRKLSSQTKPDFTDFMTRKFSEQLHRPSDNLTERRFSLVGRLSESELELTRYSNSRRISRQLGSSNNSSMSSLPSSRKTSQSSIGSEMNMQTLPRMGKESIGGANILNNTMSSINLRSFDVIHEEDHYHDKDREHQNEATSTQNHNEISHERGEAYHNLGYNKNPEEEKEQIDEVVDKERTLTHKETKPNKTEEVHSNLGYHNENTSSEETKSSDEIVELEEASSNPREMNLKEHFQLERSTIFRSSFKRDHFKDIEGVDEVIESEFDFKHCKVCMFLGIITYLYTIHHRQVFLHIFGGMFWSTTWKLFDFATESFFTQTASDIPALALIAIMCHCLNHLVLFRFKEMATRIHWKTFWEFFCGFFTVWLWAPTWYIFDIIADATSMLNFFLRNLRMTYLF